MPPWISKTATMAHPLLFPTLTLAVVPSLAQVSDADPGDLVGRRAAFGETALAERGFRNVGGRVGEGVVWTWWWNPTLGVCVTVVTEDGRYRSVTTEPPVVCHVPVTAAAPSDPGSPARTHETLRFARGSSSAHRSGSIRAGDRITYHLSIRAGQTITVALDGADGSVAFDLSAPNSSDVMHRGSAQGPRYHGSAPLGGVYQIEVYRSAAPSSRAPTVGYRLDVSVR